ncbi:endonuclease III [Candidatus Micrarchaeota archaeon]|nr:endonuclease III [Candidatus Micrarchaeota archaeon]
MKDIINIEKFFMEVEKIVAGKTIPLEKINKRKNHFKLLVSTVLSARTKDETTAPIVEELFKYIKTPEDLARINNKKLEKIIYGTGFYKTKARNLKRLGKMLVEDFDSRVPDTIEELIKLPGVGRKTANLVVSVGFNKKGICVDTHVHRITNRWGYVKTKNPFQTEMELRKKLPKKYWKKINSLLVKFGKYFCKPINPPCEECPLNEECEYGKKI